MATKAELEAELEKLRREMRQRDQVNGSGGAGEVAQGDTSRTPEAEGLQEFLDAHGINAQTVESFGANLVEELSELQQEKPLVTLVTVFALGLIIGRAFK